MFDDERRGPGGLFVASDFPALLAGAFVEGVKERVAFMIPANDERVAMEHGRTAFAVRVERLHPAEVLLPFQLALEIEAIKAARTEEGVKPLAVGDGRIGSEAAGLVTALVRPLFAQDFLPQNSSVPAADGEHDELMAMRDRHAVVNAGRIVIDRLLRLADGHCGQDVNRIAEDDGRGMAFARQRNFPADIVGLAPVDGRIGVRRDAIGQRPAPLRPVAQRLRAGTNARVTAKSREREQATEQRHQARQKNTLQRGCALPTFAAARLVRCRSAVHVSKSTTSKLPPGSRRIVSTL